MSTGKVYVCKPHLFTQFILFTCSKKVPRSHRVSWPWISYFVSNYHSWWGQTTQW